MLASATNWEPHARADWICVGGRLQLRRKSVSTSNQKVARSSMHIKVSLSKTKYRTPDCSWWAGWHVARQPSPSACEWTICRLDKRCSRSTAQQQQSFFCRFWSFQNSLLKVLLCIRHWNMNLHWLWCETSNFFHWYQWFNIFLCNYCSEVFFCFVLFSSVETLQTNFFSSLFSFFFLRPFV